MRSMGRWVVPVSLGSVARSLGFISSTNPTTHRAHVHSRPLVSLARSLWVNGFIRGGSVRSRTPLCSMILSWVLGFTQGGPGCRLVHPGYIVRVLGSSRFFSVRSRTPRWSLGSSGFV